MSMSMRMLAAHLLGAGAVLLAAPAQAAVNAEAEVSAALFAASATQAAFQKSADAKLRAERERIVALRGELKQQRAKSTSLSAALRDAESKLAAAERDFVAQLTARDRAYAEEIAVFRGQVTDIAATPEGLEALAIFNNGDELGAIAILDKLSAANEVARQKRTDIESAAEKRRIATLALEARERGKLTTAAAIARFEEVVAKDPGMFWDWIELRRLYRVAGRHSDGRRAAQRAAALTSGDRDRSLALGELGDVEMANGNLEAARAALDESLAIARSLAAADPASTLGQRDLSIILETRGDVEVFAAFPDSALRHIARTAYGESLAIRRKLAAAEPLDAVAQRDLSVIYSRFGDLEQMEGNFVAARTAYKESLSIASGVARLDPESTLAQGDLAYNYDKLGEVEKVADNLVAARSAHRESLRIRRHLSETDPANVEARGFHLETLAKLVQIEEESGDFVAAREAAMESLTIIRRLAHADPSNAGIQHELNLGLARIGSIEKSAGNLSGARVAYEESLAITRRLAGDDPQNEFARMELATSLYELGTVQQEAGITAAALDTYVECLEISRQLTEANPVNHGSQRIFWRAMIKLAAIPESGVTWSDISAEVEAFRQRGNFFGTDLVEQARSEAAK